MLFIANRQVSETEMARLMDNYIEAGYSYDAAYEAACDEIAGGCLDEDDQELSVEDTEFLGAVARYLKAGYSYQAAYESAYDALTNHRLG